MPHDPQLDDWKQLASNVAAKLVEDNMIIGLGTGSTVTYLIHALAQRLKEGLHLIGAVPTSQATHDLASSLGIPLTTLDIHPTLDLYIDGADEIDQQLRLIKGAGGALLREKIVASVAKRFVVIADATKEVTQLGQRFPVPVETVPLAATPVRQRLEALGASVQQRQVAGRVFTTENCNLILDCSFPHGITNAEELDEQMHRIVGVVETGIFLNMAQQAIIGGPAGVKILP